MAGVAAKRISSYTSKSQPALPELVMTDPSFVRILYPLFAMCLLLRIRSMRYAARA